MSRPFFNLSIVELEKIFSDGISDQSTINDLMSELKIRETSRAKALLKKINALNAQNIDDQLTILEPKISNTGVKIIKEDIEELGENIKPKIPEMISIKHHDALTIQEASKILGCSSQANWVEMESSRRKLIERLNPSLIDIFSSVENLDSLSSKAKKINDAFYSLTIIRKI